MQKTNLPSPPSDLADLGAVEAAALIRSKEVSALELVDATLARIERCAHLNAFVTVTADLAREAAREAERAVMRGDVYGYRLDLW